MIKVYGMSTCPDCIYVKEQLEGRSEFEYIEIGEDVENLKIFLKLRDTSPVFEKVRARGTVGIPFFIKEDGTVTLKAVEVGLKSRPRENTANSCTLDGKC